MSEYREQALIEAPVAAVWELVGNPSRYPAWWPTVLEVDGQVLEEGDEYVQVTDDPHGKVETTFQIDRMENLREIRIFDIVSGKRFFRKWARESLA